MAFRYFIVDIYSILIKVLTEIRECFYGFYWLFVGIRPIFFVNKKSKNGQNRGILSSVVVKYILFIYIGNYYYMNNLYSK